MKSLSMYLLRSIAAGVLLCQPPFLLDATGEMLPAPQATAAPADHADVDALEKLAQQEGESGKTAEAIRDYQRVLELRPTWKEGWWNLAALQYSADQFADAKSTL